MNPSKRETEIPIHAENVIIATKGLSCTGKSSISNTISISARCPLISMNDILDAVSMERGYSAKSPPSPEEADRLHRLACNVLLKVVHQKLSFSPFCVVVKTLLCSLSELDVLLKVALSFYSPSLVIIVECKTKNEYRFKKRLEYATMWFEREEWYKARTWEDIENARDEIDDRAWDDLARSLVDQRRDEKGKSSLVIKLVVDPFDDLNIEPDEFETTPSTLLNAIKCLILSGKAAKGEEFWLGHEDAQDSNEDKELSDEEFDQAWAKGSYVVVQYDKLQRYLFKKELKASKHKEKSKYICATKGGDCVFKFLVLEYHRYGLLNDEKISCEVCAEIIQGGQRAYTCYFCVLTMHESCARNLNLEFLQRIPYRPSVSRLLDYSKEVKEKHVCNSCTNSRKGFSKECKSCLYLTHLKCKMLPTIINHDSHKHLLSIGFLHNYVTCKPCGGLLLRATTWYACHICKFYFDVECVFLPSHVMHEHGGYDHPMKLMYSHKTGMEQEELYWCDFCYRDMDPQSWFYCCQKCPYYVTHTHCVKAKTIMEARRYDNLPIQL